MGKKKKKEQKPLWTQKDVEKAKRELERLAAYYENYDRAYQKARDDFDEYETNREKLQKIISDLSED